MQYKKEKWLAQYKASAEKMQSNGPTDGIVAIHAALSYIRDGMVNDIGETSEEDKAFCTTIRESLAELFTECQKTTDSLAGFASNASAAAAACKLKGKASEKELMSL